MSGVPASRLRLLRDVPENGDGEFVLYWMVSARRTVWNFGLQHAAELAQARGCGLVVLEALRVDYPMASDRFHAFVLEGMADNQQRLEGKPVHYFPHVERSHGEGKGLLAALAARARLVVTDDTPAFFLGRMTAAAAAGVPARMVAVDSCGLLPLSTLERVPTRAVDFRRQAQKVLPAELDSFPARNPLARLALPSVQLPAGILKRWPAATREWLRRAPVAELPIDHDVGPVAEKGGAGAAQKRLRRFLAEKLDDYLEGARHPDEGGESGLSAYLHFGHISAHQVFAEIAGREGWTPDRLEEVAPRGQREGWWGLSPGAEAFLDQLVTWRELSYHFARHERDGHRYETLPAWARATLEAHESDPRPHLYPLEELARGETDDPIWNAAATQLRTEGRIHGYLRMLWGKRILEWTPTARRALEVMLELNDRYAVDGRDPNSVSGITWVLGRFDRAWPERAIFGKVRCMTSASTKSKLRLRRYLALHEGVAAR